MPPSRSDWLLLLAERAQKRPVAITTAQTEYRERQRQLAEELERSPEWLQYCARIEEWLALEEQAMAGCLAAIQDVSVTSQGAEAWRLQLIAHQARAQAFKACLNLPKEFLKSSPGMPT